MSTVFFLSFYTNMFSLGISKNKNNKTKQTKIDSDAFFF